MAAAPPAAPAEAPAAAPEAGLRPALGLMPDYAAQVVGVSVQAVREGGSAAKAGIEAGDVIVTGTPGGVGYARTPPVWMKAGDTIEIEIEKIGVLRNPIVAEAV